MKIDMEYYYNSETKEMRLEKPQFPSESSEDGSRDFLKSVTGRKEFSPAFRLRIRRTAVSLVIGRSRGFC
jgi:hypothetical protein